MNRTLLALVALLLYALPATAQDLPPDVPRYPGQSPAERERERREERYLKDLAPFFIGADVAAMPSFGRYRYSTGINALAGLTMHTGDEIAFRIGLQQYTRAENSAINNAGGFGVVYDLNMARIPGTTLPEGSFLGFSVMTHWSEVSVLTAEVRPTYRLRYNTIGSVPLSLIVGMQRFGKSQDEKGFTRLYVGVGAGIRFGLGERKRNKLYK